MRSTMTVEEILEALRQRVEGRSQKVVARDLGVSEAYLSDVLRGRRPPADAIAKAMGFERLTVFRRVA